MPDSTPTSLAELELARRAPLEAEINSRAEQHAEAWTSALAAVTRPTPQPT